MISRKSYITQHSRLGTTPKFWHWIFLAPVFVPRLTGWNRLQGKSRDFLRQLRAVSLSEDLKLETESLPPIEILSVAAGKDLEFLGFTLSSAVKFSKNEIKKISIICPKKDVGRCQELILKTPLPCEVSIIDEETQIKEVIRNQLHDRFGRRYGWVLQQLLALNYILNSNAHGILLLNADTIIMREVEWVDSSRNQILMASVEYHEPYYKFLHKILHFSLNPKYTFVTHHMFFQPLLYKAILEKRGFSSLESLVKVVIEQSDRNESSPFCIEFEPYAQGMLQDFAGYVRLRKFSNLSMLRTPENISSVRNIIDNDLSSEYNSVSFHDYLTHDRS